MVFPWFWESSTSFKVGSGDSFQQLQLQLQAQLPRPRLTTSKRRAWEHFLSETCQLEENLVLMNRKTIGKPIG